MEAKLKEYRALRRRKEFIDNTKEKIAKSKTKLFNLLVPKIFREMGNEKEEEVLLIENEEPPPIQKIQRAEEFEESEVLSETSEIESLDEDNPEAWKYCALKYTMYAIVWLSLFIYFLQIQFGAVFFVISVLIGIYFNTRTSPRKRGEVSAYSVFNENCQSIDGTLKAEQFEREIRYGAGTVRSF